MSNFSILSELNILDLVLILTLLISAFTGYRLGILQSLLKTFGYITGGVSGVYTSINFLKSFDSILIKGILFLVIVISMATIGKFAFSKIGLALCKSIFPIPLKFFNSVLGSLAACTKTTFVIYIVFNILDLNKWFMTSSYLEESYFHNFMSTHLNLSKLFVI